MTNTIWSWQHGFMQSDLAPTTRLVLFILASHLNSVGESCFPGTQRIADESGLSERSVCTHLDIAENEGWIEVSKHGFSGRKWRRNEYKPLFKVVNEVYQQGTEGGSVPSKQGTEPNDNKALKEVQSSRPLEITTLKEEITKEEKSLPSGITIEIVEEVKAYRKLIKAPLTPRALRSILRTLSKAPTIGCTVEDVLSEMQEAGWRGLKLSWVENRRKTGESNGKNRKLCGVDRVIQANIKRLQELGDLPTDSAGNSGPVREFLPDVSR